MCSKHSSTSTSSLIPVTLYLVMFVMIMIPSIAASGACFKCRSFPRDTYGSTDGCSDPFDSQMSSHEMRQCPPGESCVKILGVYRTGQQLGKDVMIRDCLRASYSNAGYIRDTNIQYYGDRIDGFMHVCTRNYCNKASGRINGRQKDTSVIIIMSSASASLLFFFFPPYFVFLNPKQ